MVVQSDLRDSSSKTSRNAMALMVLSLGGFGIGLSEFVIAGLLTELSESLSVSISAAGNLVSVYALAVVPGALLLTPFLMRKPPKVALAVFMFLFLLGNFISACAPGYLLMLLGRMITALAHGGYFGIGAVLAAQLVPPAKKASAVAMLFAGLTVANVLGVPLGTAIGQQYGWRAVFLLIAGVGFLALIGILSILPLTSSEESLPLSKQLKILMTPRVSLSLCATACVFGGMFGVFTYSEPLMRQIAGFHASFVPILLVLFGIGLFLGNVLGGKLADKNPDKAVLIFGSLLPVSIGALVLTTENKFLFTVFFMLMGLVGFGTVPGLQARIMRYADGARTLASAVNIAAFNAGNMLGVFLSSLAISAGYGLRSPAVSSILVALLGLILLVLSFRAESTGHT